ncbi:MAG: sigma-70 family RNA polymerase sigma factor, partial [Candidatus Eremiobacterota bacterium]
MSDSEQDLVERCLAGDQTAWEELYRAYQGRVRQVIGWKRWGFSPIEVEDGVQEVFLEFVRSLPRYRGEASLSTYLTRLARNRCISHLRKKTALKRGKEELGFALEERHANEDTPVALAIENGAGPEEALLAQEEAVRVGGALTALGEECREILRLRYFRQLSYNEICTALDLPLGTVCSR